MKQYGNIFLSLASIAVGNLLKPDYHKGQVHVKAYFVLGSVVAAIGVLIQMTLYFLFGQVTGYMRILGSALCLWFLVHGLQLLITLFSNRLYDGFYSNKGLARATPKALGCNGTIAYCKCIYISANGVCGLYRSILRLQRPSPP